MDAVARESPVLEMSKPRARSRSCLTRVAWTLVSIVLALFAAQAFIGDLYRVDSPSMMPTLRPGQWVFVRYSKRPPRRGEVVVARSGEGLVVKRAVGLDGDVLRIVRGGDVKIDAPAETASGTWAPRIALFDSGSMDVAEHFSMGSTQENPWCRVDGEWQLDARLISRGSQAGLLRLPSLNADWIEPNGERTRHDEGVGDGYVEATFRPLAAGGRVRLVWIEQGDRFELSVELGGAPEQGGGELGAVTLTRRDASGLQALSATTWPVEIGRELSIAFSNVDNVLRAELLAPRPGVPVAPIVVRYVENSLHPQDLGKQAKSYGPRLMLGGEGCHLALRHVRVWRDLHYTQRGEYGTSSDYDVASEHVFLLGDNSTASRDSREWGALPYESLVGRASLVVWPLRDLLRRVR